MTRLIIIYGTISGIIELALLALTMLFVTSHGSMGMVLGYLSMLVALSLVFVGVKKYRDEHRGGVIGFWKALGVGLGIAGVAALFYMLGWEAYMWATDYRFTSEFTASAIASMKAKGATAQQIADAAKEFDAFAVMYANPVNRMAMTLSEIAPVALLVPLLSALLLRKASFMPARAR